MSVVTLLLLATCNSATFVDRLVLVNDGDYHATVDVRGEAGGWLGLGTVRSDDTKEFEQVIDQGSLWTFRFSYGSHDPLEITMNRSELADAGWQVEVPDELEENLRAEGVPPPP